jgi:ribosomal protein S12 methylthiotransferase
MLGALAEQGGDGFKIVGNPQDADVLVVNTCAFIDSAKKESVEAILDAVRLKEQGKVRRVVVTGCLAQRYREDLAREIPEVDAFLGIESAASISNVVFGSMPSQRILPTTLTERYPLIPRTRLRESTAPWSAYVKVSEGCDHQCAFCSIPSFRGRHRSKPIERVVAEAEQLADSGAVELNLIAQDTTAYGMDLYQRLALPELLEKLSEVEEIRWIRLLYCYPTMVTARLMETLRELPKVVPYVDMPLQHADDEMLKAMKRGGNADSYRRLFHCLREGLPDIALRTTFIVGFPGETDEHFEQLMAFVEEVRFDRVGVFLYSPEEGTPAYAFGNSVPRNVAVKRRDALMRLQQRISLSKNQSWIGRELDVLVEHRHGSDMVGRSFRDAPEIDGSVMIKNLDALPGSFVRAKITTAGPYDLVAS